MFGSDKNMDVLDEEELKEFLEENEGVELWGEDEVEEFLKRADSVSSEEGYVLDHENKELGIRIEQRPGKSGSIEVRASFSIPDKRPDEFFRFISDFEYSKSYDSMVKKYEVLKRLTKFQSICVYESKEILKWIISGRDFVYVCIHKEVKPGHFVYLSKGCNYDDAYPCPKGTVRGRVHHTLFYSKPHPDNPEEDTLVTYMASADGKGYVPQWVANWVTRKFGPIYTKQLVVKFLEYSEYLKNKKKEESNNESSESEDEEEESSSSEEESSEEDEEEGEDDESSSSEEEDDNEQDT